MKVFGNIDFVGAGHTTPDNGSSDIGDSRVAVFSNSVTLNDAEALATVVAGMSVTPSLGTHLISFNAQYSCSISAVTEVAKQDLTAVRAYLLALPMTSIHPLVFGMGEVILPGVYDIIGAGSVTGWLTFDAQNNSNALFVIRCSAAFSTAASASMALINGAKASNIFWMATGAVSLGATNIFKGSIIGDAAIDVGDTGQVDGSLFSIGGAISFTNVTMQKPGVSIVNLQSLGSFSVFTSLGAVSNTGVSVIHGDIGTGGGAVTGFDASTLYGSIYTPGNSSFIAEMGIYQNGALNQNSLRTIVHNIAVTGSVITLQGLSNLITVENQTVDIRIRVLLGSILVKNRILTSQKLE